MPRWYFDLEDEMWVWRCYDPAGMLLKQSQKRFAYYLDAVADARLQGFETPPVTADARDASHGQPR